MDPWQDVPYEWFDTAKGKGRKTTFNIQDHSNSVQLSDSKSFAIPTCYAEMSLSAEFR